MPGFTSNNPPSGVMENTVTTLRVGDVTFDDEGAQFVEAEGGVIFTDYMVINRYEQDEQTYLMPITSPTGFKGSFAAFCQLACPTLVLCVDWTAMRVGKQPSVPSTELNTPGWVLLSDSTELAKVTYMPDGTTPVYRISGTYVYGQSNPGAGLFDNVVFPKPPYLTDTVDRTMPKSLIEKGIADAPGGKPAGTKQLQIGGPVIK